MAEGQVWICIILQDDSAKRGNLGIMTDSIEEIAVIDFWSHDSM